MVSDKAIFMCFLCKPMKTTGPSSGAIFAHRGIIWTNFVEFCKLMLHDMYHGLKLCGFREED